MSQKSPADIRRPFTRYSKDIATTAPPKKRTRVSSSRLPAERMELGCVLKAETLFVAGEAFSNVRLTCRYDVAVTELAVARTRPNAAEDG